jgi:uncharacterized RDD family membrane protein YckC
VTAGALPAAPAAAHESPALAPLLRRSASLAYESLLLAAIVIVTGFAAAPFVSPVTSREPAPHIPATGARVLSACAVIAAAGVYFVWSWTGGRRTLPMKTWRMTLVRADGRPVDARTAVIRYLAGWIGPLASLAAYVALEPAGLGLHAGWLIALNFLWALIDRDRQFLHDRIAGTRIVMADPAPGPAQARRPG